MIDAKKKTVTSFEHTCVSFIFYSHKWNTHFKREALEPSGSAQTPLYLTVDVAGLNHATHNTRSCTKYLSFENKNREKVKLHNANSIDL
jgi:hypothetical protein